jgi:1-deoxy-D-xylulose-5-phosphate reductoisomerase
LASKVALAGSTGSIGNQAIDVVHGAPDRFEVVALAAGSDVSRLAAQARDLRPSLVVIGDASLAGELAEQVPRGTEVMSGTEGLEALARSADVVLNAIVGFAGLPVTLAALVAGRRLALANKESLIAAAPLVSSVRNAAGGEIVPVDSEHCAIHQCLRACRESEVARLVITASGGPFRELSQDELAHVGLGDALAHPTWDMGPKITVDSSTLMNKGLEVIEAHELFGLPYDRIEVVVHPQSIVHSMVEMTDGSTIAQLSRPDMRLPIGYALGYPERLCSSYGALDWSTALSLDFEPPDRERFACLRLAEEAGRAGGSAPAWLSAANEEAVAAFLSARIPWSAISQVVAAALEDWDQAVISSVGDVVEADRRARESARRTAMRLEHAA